MGRITGLVPSRFLTLLAHLVVVITLFWSRESNIQACLPLKFTPEEYEKQDIQLVAALCLTLGLFAVELAGFLSGVSMFNSTQSLLCILSACRAFPYDSSPPPFFPPFQTFWAQVSAQVANRISLAIAAHCSASVALSFFIFERWECTTYWYIFAFCRCRSTPYFRTG
ncbi:hypothetical protein A6R68_03954, partial [Neotoma lepida]